MWITVDLDDEALAGAMDFANGRTLTEVINDALRHFTRVERRHIEALVSRMPEDHRPEELDWGKPEGREVW